MNDAQAVLEAAGEEPVRARPVRLRKTSEKAIAHSLAFCGSFSTLVLGGICFLLFWQGIKAFDEVSFIEFISTTRWNPTSWDSPGYGILSMIASTFLVTAGSMLIVVPLGIGIAAYTSEFAPTRVRSILKPAVEMLAAIPSVVIGFIGITVTGPFIAEIFGLPNGLNALNGSILLAVMALPTAASLSEDALRSVPKDWRQASLALGAGRWETLRRVTIPAAAPGIMAAMMLSMGRAIGETMTVLMACGNAPAFPESFLQAVRPLTATIAIELGEVPQGTAHFFSLFAVGLALFSISFMVNILADRFLRRKAGE